MNGESEQWREMAKRCGQCILGRPRAAQRLVMESPHGSITMTVNSDHAGCLRTKCSTTGLAALHG